MKPVTAADIKRAQEILRRYRSHAIGTQNDEELDNVEHLMHVVPGAVRGLTYALSGAMLTYSGCWRCPSGNDERRAARNHRPHVRAA